MSLQFQNHSDRGFSVVCFFSEYIKALTPNMYNINSQAERKFNKVSIWVLRIVAVVSVFFCGTLISKAGFLSGMIDTYYPTHSIGSYGAIDIFHDGGDVVSFWNGLSINDSPVAKFVTEMPNGDSKYSLNRQYGRIEYYVSTDRTHLEQVVYMFGDWTITTWYTSSKDEQQAFYEANKNYRTKGLVYDFSWNESSSSSNADTHSNINKKSTCSNCNGTGIDPTTSGTYTI